ncbi:Aminotransferase-like mobile domain-containing protein [Artemisia annua]|uniref:Aminotransferase-like mobile domain-containing protein n=1 Tax=Artemisia annua TaxID=35608 RepID=A0A2U1MAG2_ARTAN|nr:Aminotransferase-like mobile domain-containing protein [Artemisia annua]
MTLQCENSHIACSSCCTKMERSECPYCKKIGSKSNQCRGLEKFIKSIRIYCKNAMYGCKKILPYSKKSEHEQMCPQALCNCPYPSSEFEEEAEEGDGEVLGKDDDDNLLGTLQVVLNDPNVLDCSICFEPLSTPIY